MTTLSKKIGIDLGTSRVVVYVKGEGVVLNEPAVLATDEKGLRVLAMGTAASDLKRRGGAAKLVRLARDGNGLDYGVAGAMLQHLIGRVCGRQRLFRPDVMLSIPSRVTSVERRSVLEATMQAGAKTAYLIEKPLAAAIGANLPVASAQGIVVGNLGASGVDAAVIAMGEIVAMESIAGGGMALDHAIAAALLQRHGVQVPPAEAERLKIRLGSATLPATNVSLEVSGRDSNGRSVAVTIGADEVCDAIRPVLDEMANGLTRLIEQAAPEQRSHIAAEGVVLTGGGAQLRGIAEFLSARLQLPVRIARDPQACVAVGTGVALDNFQSMRRGQHYIT